jgi:hypothetical protein
VILPELRHGVRDVTARFFAQRNDDRSSLLHLRDTPLEEAQLRRVDDVVGEVDGQERCLDPVQPSLRLVVA